MIGVSTPKCNPACRPVDGFVSVGCPVACGRSLATGNVGASRSELVRRGAEAREGVCSVQLVGQASEGKLGTRLKLFQIVKWRLSSVRYFI